VGVTRQQSRKFAGSMVEFRTKPWLSHHAGASSGLFKRLVYFIIRPLLSFKYPRYLSQETIQECQPRFCLGARGLPLESRRSWGSKYLQNVREALVVARGTGMSKFWGKWTFCPSLCYHPLYEKRVVGGILRGPRDHQNLVATEGAIDATSSWLRTLYGTYKL
jgi:hypothetical protein